MLITRIKALFSPRAEISFRQQLFILPSFYPDTFLARGSLFIIPEELTFLILGYDRNDHALQRLGYCQIDDEEYLEIQQQIPILTGIGLTILEYSTTTFLITSPFDY